MVTVVEKSNGKRLAPWEVANASFHAGEEVRSRKIELVRSARLVPAEQRKKWNGKDLFEPGEIFYMSPGKGLEKTAHVFPEPVVDFGDHFGVLDRKENKIRHRLTSAIAVRNP
ncbi:MAG TPA: hypothetical protein VFE96_01870 [Candidatus Bathyarchaeia archaeon]|jgi:hypothetical protein|nr:hypothetical protein [Candidatus Bathyarchaeia archaeon]